MNSKLREALEELGMTEFHNGKTGAGVLSTAVNKAEKAIRQAVGEEMLELLPDEIINDDAKRLRDGTFVRGDDMRRIGHNDCLRELRQKIKEWAVHQGDI